MVLTDIYVFRQKKSKKDILNFINKYLSSFISKEDYFEFPKYSSNDLIIFETNEYEEMLNFVLDSKNLDYTFYLENKNNPEYIQGIIRINSDETLCLGLGVLPEYENKYINKLKLHYNTKYIFVCQGTPPPTSRKEIMELFDKEYE